MPESSLERHRSLSAYRKAHKLSQREAADRHGVTQGEWQRYEAGTRRPRLDLAKRLAEETGVALSRILNHKLRAVWWWLVWVGFT